MQDERKITPLDESSSRQIWVGWGSAVVCLGLAYLVGGLFFPYALVFFGAALAIRGHFPGIFAKHIDAKIIAGTPYRREESIKAWATVLSTCVLLAWASSSLHRRLFPQQTEPLVTIEPERDSISSPDGHFVMLLSNHGIEIDHPSTDVDYFVAQKEQAIHFKRIFRFGGEAIPVVLRTNQTVPFDVDFSGYVETAYLAAVATNRAPSLLGVKITATFKRFSDQKQFQIVRGFGVVKTDQQPNLPRLWILSGPSGSYVKPGPDGKEFALSTEEAIPYIEDQTRWSELSVTFKGADDGSTSTTAR